VLQVFKTAAFDIKPETMQSLMNAPVVAVKEINKAKRQTVGSSSH
jgi:hypothetical protein